MKYLIVADIDTDEQIHKLDLEKVKNIAVFDGDEVNKFAWIYGAKADIFEKYLVVQYETDDGSTGFVAPKYKEVYIYFE